MDITDKPESERMVRAREALRLMRSRLAHTRSPERRVEIERQVAQLRDSADEAEIMAFIEAIADIGDE